MIVLIALELETHLNCRANICEFGFIYLFIYLIKFIRVKVTYKDVLDSGVQLTSFSMVKSWKHFCYDEQDKDVYSHHFYSAHSSGSPRHSNQRRKAKENESKLENKK